MGNLRTALFAWLQTRSVDGTFVLRMEDLDVPRTVKGSAESILADLRTVGIDWDEGPDVGGPFGPYTQSERYAFYENALTKLDEAGLVYPCYCSRKEIAQAASAPHGKTAVYPGTCSQLTIEERTQREEETGRSPAFRFRVSGTVTFEDKIVGTVRQNLETEVGDFVIRRRDHIFAYQLAVVVDDGEMAITDVLRGDDLLDSTARQIALFEALGYTVPTFWHVPLMLDDSGSRMSKRDGSDSLHDALKTHSVNELLHLFLEETDLEIEASIDAFDLLHMVKLHGDFAERFEKRWTS